MNKKKKKSHKCAQITTSKLKENLGVVEEEEEKIRTPVMERKEKDKKSDNKTFDISKFHHLSIFSSNLRCSTRNC